MDKQRLYSLTRKAIDDYNMIEENDKIAIGISGGKDSLALLLALSGLRQFYPKKFEIEAITVNTGVGNMDFTPIKHLCDELKVSYHIIDTEIYNIVFEARKEKNPCALCAKMRKGAFNNYIKDLNCNKLAYAHHKDDVIETFFLSLLMEGRLHTFSPVTKLDQSKLTLIRPLIYINEADIIGLKNKYNLPVVTNQCPADKVTKREFAHNLIKYINKDVPGVKEKIFTAIKNSKINNW